MKKLTEEEVKRLFDIAGDMENVAKDLYSEEQEEKLLNGAMWLRMFARLHS